MPNIWTHFIFGQLVLDHLEENKLIALNKQLTMFNMGCQGPDFLFYHRFLPWLKRSALNSLGTEMHDRNCGPVIMEMLDHVKGRSIEDEHTEASFIYAVGFVLHHVLDRHMHPFVFSRSGFRKWDHQRYEIMMDTLIARKLRKIETWKTPVYREINTEGGFPTPIIDAFELIVHNYFPEIAPFIRREEWNNANRDMINAQRLFHDPTWIKRAFTFGQLEPFLFRRDVPFDVLNEAGLPWIDPTDKLIDHHDTAWELWDHAMQDAILITRSVLTWLRDKGDDLQSLDRQLAQRHTVVELIGNYSYETGLPCDTGAKIRYADPIWPDGSVVQAP